MKNLLFNTDFNATRWQWMILIIRLSIASMMLVHGVSKLDKLFVDGPVQFGDPIGIGATASLALVVFAEIVCSVLLGLGLATRWACITMLVAVFITHAEHPFGKKEMGLMYLLFYMMLLVIGPGKYSLDALITKTVEDK